LIAVCIAIYFLLYFWQLFRKLYVHQKLTVMKKLISFCLIILIGIACQTKPKPVDMEATNIAITEVLDKVNDAMKRMDVDSYMTFLSEDGLYCGTDESEFWDKKGLKKVQLESMPDSIQTINLLIDKRVIRITSDGNSAIAVEQFMETDMFGPNLPFRIDYHLIKEDDKWLIDFMNMSFIPYNEDLGTIISTLKNKRELSH